ncbi:MAG: hypothetical protein COA86_10840 [Kangiella sp.]|nr:MAG: hypothetical protein COA86_10840 [Kangiella sp.]
MKYFKLSPILLIGICASLSFSSCLFAEEGQRFDRHLKQVSLKERAEKALTKKQYPLAVSLLTKLLNSAKLSKNDDKRAFAIEFLGVAKERQFQLAFAKKYYLMYLKEFPKHTYHSRVKQRLRGLLGMQSIVSNSQQVLEKGNHRRRKQINNTRGSLGASYRKSDLVNDLGERRETLSLVGVDLNVRGLYELDDSSLQVKISAGHYQDLTDDERSTNDRLSYLNAVWKSNDGSYQVDFGRQRNRRKGLFNRFDGVVFGYGVNKSQTLNFYTGYPVASSRNLFVDTERSFVGASYDWNDIFKNIDISLFVLNQTIESLTDRRAVGAELKYINQRTSVFSLIDYDIFHSELNAILLSGSYSTKERTRFNWSLNQRKSPYISTRNALIGQPADSLEELQNLFLTDDEILNLALDRTLESRSASFQVSYPISKKYEISSNINWLDLSGAPASGGVTEIIDRGAQIYLNSYLRASKLFSQNDTNQLGIRISQRDTSDVWSVYVSSQYRWLRLWTFSSKLRYDQRENTNGSSQENISPSFRIQYQEKEHFIYTELGAILYTNQLVGLGDFKTDIYYLYVGYQFYF